MTNQLQQTLKENIFSEKSKVRNQFGIKVITLTFMIQMHECKLQNYLIL